MYFFRLPRPARLYVLVLLLTAALGSGGCAYSYKPIQTSDLDYPHVQTSGPYEISYRYKMLDYSTNTRWGRKAAKKGVYVVGVRIQNNADQALTLNEGTLHIRAGEEPVWPINGATAAAAIKQATAPHLLWSLLWVTFYRTTSTDGSRSGSETTIALPVGVPIAIANFMKGRSANRAIKEDFASQDLLSRTIPAGDSAEGLLFLSNASYRPLTFEIKPVLARGGAPER